MKPFKFFYPYILLLVIVILYSCRDDILPYPLEKGTILGKEICQQDVLQDYWLINLDKSYGDTLTYKGILYNHVVKTKQLDPLLKKNGMRVILGFDISTDKIASANCSFPSSETYPLKVLQLRSQSELR